MTMTGLVNLSGSLEEGELYEHTWDSTTKEKGEGVRQTPGNTATYLKIILNMKIFKHKAKCYNGFPITYL